MTTRVLLLVEDNPGDADLVLEYLDEDLTSKAFRVVQARTMATAIEALRFEPIDVVLLDLGLPDAKGVETVASAREIAGETPILVFTGSDDEALGIECIEAGAQDYLNKSELRPTSRRRAIGYAMTRVREAQVRELEATIARLRELSSLTSGTSLTGALVGSGSVSIRSPEVFDGLVEGYAQVLRDYVEGYSPRRAMRAMMERITTRVGDAAGGPRDLLDVHVAALDAFVVGGSASRSSVALEGRLLAIEMMGLLVNEAEARARSGRPWSPPAR